MTPTFATHTLRQDALEAGLLLIAQQQHPVRTLKEADARCTSFDLDQTLTVWQPECRNAAPPVGMGTMTLRLQTLTYCVFVGIWQGGVGSLVEHPVSFPPKSVSLAVATKESG